MHYPSIQHLQQQLEQQLRAHPKGISEHALIKQLQTADEKILPHGQLHNPLALFQIHFILFHALYQLRDKLWERQQGRLEIKPLLIKLWPYQTGRHALSHNDPLRIYYLDLNNLETTGEKDVTELLATFWHRLNNGDGRRTALDELGLCDPVDDETIKQTWRQLVMQHHPDRGGNKTRLQIINSAMDWLRKN